MTFSRKTGFHFSTSSPICLVVRRLCVCPCQQESAYCCGLSSKHLRFWDLFQANSFYWYYFLSVLKIWPPDLFTSDR